MHTTCTHVHIFYITYAHSDRQCLFFRKICILFSNAFIIRGGSQKEEHRDVFSIQPTLEGRAKALGIQYFLAFSYVLVELRQQEFLQRNIATSVAIGVGRGRYMIGGSDALATVHCEPDAAAAGARDLLSWHSNNLLLCTLSNVNVEAVSIIYKQRTRLISSSIRNQNWPTLMICTAGSVLKSITKAWPFCQQFGKSIVFKSRIYNEKVLCIID